MSEIVILRASPFGGCPKHLGGLKARVTGIKMMDPNLDYGYVCPVLSTYVRSKTAITLLVGITDDREETVQGLMSFFVPLPERKWTSIYKNLANMWQETKTDKCL